MERLGRLGRNDDRGGSCTLGHQILQKVGPGWVPVSGPIIPYRIPWYDWRSRGMHLGDQTSLNLQTSSLGDPKGKRRQKYIFGEIFGLGTRSRCDSAALT